MHTFKSLYLYLGELFLTTTIAQNTYSHYTIEVTIPYYIDVKVPNAVPFTDPPRVNVELRNGNKSIAYHPTIDTGTCGYVVSVDGFPGWSQQLANASEKGWEFLSSSKKLYSGHWIPVDMFYTDAPVEVETRVPVLVVEESTICPHYNETRDTNTCPTLKGTLPRVVHHPPNISLFGVGFGRQKDGQPQGSPDKNPFLNIVNINKTSTNTDLFRNGYMLDRNGITLGLTGSNTKDLIRWNVLKRGDLWDTDHRDWRAPRACFSVDDSTCVEGNLLIDTGIAHSYLTLPTGAQVHTHTDTNPSTHAPVRALNNGSVVQLKVRDDFGYAVDTEFIVGSPEGIAPSMVIVTLRDPAEKEPFLNTGRHFLRSWKVAFDAVGGKFGFRRVV
ncbi:outer membrane autotransporter barrel protein [Glarea lozoyensis ATCC 20868]|uniref:Outer membrane autotransporter barrel protein n=1 Tax=Glarea lozoyensis (strain ATCC 20868 / MF5171) TaxID=1116229 RepID=S3CNC4_GLAL2|nr:outer membrane autotransporter barrel protein [Glarea lozoyensis ATCC 20868]EPE27987.1 outer membrane autotransporter barrel protein [Glarea lozoyensis ATCC 20868]